MGLFANRVGTVFVDNAWSYDIVYKNSSSRYLSEVIVNLSNGSYRYPSSVKADILKKDGDTWEVYYKDVTDKVTFLEDGIYKIKYTAEGMSVETEEFMAYRPFEIYDITPTQEYFADGAEIRWSDFTYIYCYKDEYGNIGISNSGGDNVDVCYYVYDEEGTVFSILQDDLVEKYEYAENLKVTIFVGFNDPDGNWDRESIPITVKKNCEYQIRSNAAFLKPKKTATYYEFSGSIKKRFVNEEGKTIGTDTILEKTDSGVRIADGYTVYISGYIPSENSLSTDELKEKYKNNATWNLITDSNINSYFGNKTEGEISSGYYLIKVEEGGVEITSEYPAYIRILY